MHTPNILYRLIPSSLCPEIEEQHMRCDYCEKDAIYRCSACGRLLCAEHVKIETVCASHAKKSELMFTVRRVTSEEERSTIRKFVRRFWGEEKQVTFDRKFAVAELPAYVAKVQTGTIGFISFSPASDALIIVALGVLPRYQRCGIGSRLIEKVEGGARRLGKGKVLELRTTICPLWASISRAASRFTK
jgi:GNAT superfamily N-acetyltransferase